MTEEIEPALSAEEWMQYGADRTVMRDLAMGKRPWGPRRRFTDDQKLHAVAAIALYRQAFGFTHEDVHLLEQQALYFETSGGLHNMTTGYQLRRVARRIAALLPPEGVEPHPVSGEPIG